jgi:hypothetical protein
MGKGDILENCSAGSARGFRQRMAKPLRRIGLFFMARIDPVFADDRARPSRHEQRAAGERDRFLGGVGDQEAGDFPAGQHSRCERDH